VDQVRQLFRQVAGQNRGNKVLCDVLLDAENVLHGPYPESREASDA
jgi:hypothetical protein